MFSFNEPEKQVKNSFSKGLKLVEKEKGKNWL
jgi:hypothetical protein